MPVNRHRPLLLARLPLSGREAVRRSLLPSPNGEPLYPVRVQLWLTRREVEALEALAQTLPRVATRLNLGRPATALLRAGLQEMLLRDPNLLPPKEAKKKGQPNPENDADTEDEAL